MNFNAKKTTNEIIDFIKKYYKKNNAGGAIIGLSGGKDSAVCLALLSKAIGSENILGLWLPSKSRETDKKDVYLLAKKYNIELIEHDINNYVDNFINDIKNKNNVSDDILKDAIINSKPRIRMLTLYSYAAMMSKLKNKIYLVVGTSNKSERFVGYFTKGGDGVCDIAPIADLYVDEVIKIGEYLAVPEHIVHKTPDDGLSGVSDEEKLGFTYDDVKNVSEELCNSIIDNSVNNDIRKRILEKHNNNLHKFIIPMYQRKNNNEKM